MLTDLAGMAGLAALHAVTAVLGFVLTLFSGAATHFVPIAFPFHAAVGCFVILHA